MWWSRGSVLESWTRDRSVAVQRCRWRTALLLLLLVVPLLLHAEASPLRDARKAGRGGGGGDEEGIKEGRDGLIPRHEWKRRHRKSSECRLGRERYGLHESWSPNLGPPFGVWGCVQCTCEPVQKKRRMVAKVRCRNIKDQCPKVTCREPVLLPGACCKACPHTPAIPAMQGLPASRDEPVEASDATGRDFAVLLNGRTSQTPMTTSRVATGRLSLRKKNLHFSFLLEDGYPPPASIHFLDDEGNILEQLEAQSTPYEATNNRICGTWTRVPRDYRGLLRDEKMWVALQPPSDCDEDMISGQVSRYVGVDTEVFSALLKPSPSTNQTLSGGGTAIISVDARTDSLHVSLVFNGVFGSSESQNSTLVVELRPLRALPPVTDTVVLSKAYSDINHAELMTTLGETSLRLLTRGQVSLRIWSAAAPELGLEGMVTPRATCNVYSAVLTPPPTPADETTSVATTGPYGSGWALLTLSNDGTFGYQVMVEGVEVSRLTLETTHRRRDRVVDDLTESLVDSWANGTYSRPTYRDLDALLRGKIEVVATTEDGGELRGMLAPVAITEALRSPQPALLSHPGLPMAATVWVAVDAACVMHYDVMLAGQHPGTAPEPYWNLTLKERDQVWDPRFDNVKLRLEDEVEGHELSAHTTMLTQLSLSRLQAGVTYLELDLIQPDLDVPPPALSGRIQGVNVPTVCLLDLHNPISPAVDHEVQGTPDCKHFECMDASQPDPFVHKCIDQDKNVFEDGTSWPSPVNQCSMCMCTRGVIRCLDMVCPSVDCPNPVTPQGECCPVCPGDPTPAPAGEGAACTLNNVRHSVSSKWHPFLAPKGFDRCTVCTCVMDPRGFPNVNCSRLVSSCPDLPCAESETVTNPNSCCPTCKPQAHRPTASPALPDMPNDRVILTSEQQREEILRRGGCSRGKNAYENGAEWHPKVAWIGDYKCVTCKCKDGKLTCDKQCPVLECPRKIHVGQECCPRCANSVEQQKTPKKKPGYKKRNSG